MKKTKEIPVSPEERLMTPKLDFDEINKLIKLLEDRNLAEFELEVEGFKIKVCRNAQVVYTPVPQAAATFQPPSRTDGQGGMPNPMEPPPAEPKGNVHYVTSPIVGTFYRAPSPSSPPFVDVGDPVKKKQTLCIVEAMKLMNEIECDVDGVVKEIFVENGKPVEFGQKLFAVVPTA
jgi:acetyl-CoA carboxylase biotin carboxyl carrier protein